MRAALRLALMPTLFFGLERGVATQPPVPADRPYVLSSTFWGGGAFEDPVAVLVDRDGNAYVIGNTSSSDFPTTMQTLPAGAAVNVFIVKLSPTGALLYSTRFGGPGYISANAAALDPAGHLVIAGDVAGEGLPVVNPVHDEFHPGGCGEFGGTCPDGFVAKIDAGAENLLLSSYIGTDRYDTLEDVAVDGAGNILVIGSTQGSPFEGASPLRPFAGTQDAYVAKIPPAGGSFSYFTFLGGTFSETGHGIAVDPAGNAYLTGSTESQNFPVLGPIQAAPENFSTSAFVTKLTPGGSLAYSTYLSGHQRDVGFDIAVDAAGSAHVAGVTSSTNFPVVNPHQPFRRGFVDAFVSRIAPSGSTLIYSTYLGGTGREEPQFDFQAPVAIALDPDGNLYVSGTTESADFPALFPVHGFGGGVCLDFPLFALRSCRDAFVTKYDPRGRLMFSSPVGGLEDDHGRGVAAGADGSVYLVGNTYSTDFPVRAPLQPAPTRVPDAFITRIAARPPDCQIAAAVLLAPSGATADATPTFAWQAIPGATVYAILVSRVADVLLSGTPPAQLVGITGSTSYTPGPAFPAGDYVWTAVGLSSSCGLGKLGDGLAFTIPATCPGPAVQISPINGASTGNPVRFDWTVPGGANTALSVVVVVDATGRFVVQEATSGQTLTLHPLDGMSFGNYLWYVVTWNSACGASVTGPALFFNTGGAAGAR